jgi:hypothetical protein
MGAASWTRLAIPVLREFNSLLRHMTSEAESLFGLPSLLLEQAQMSNCLSYLSSFHQQRLEVSRRI